jgi:predicted TPR repeat methyltransferase
MSAADAAFACALEHWQAESLQAAHAACLEALGHDAEHVPAAVLASEILLRAGAPQPAVALLERVAELAPGDGAALLLLARAQRSAGELAPAERSARAARACSPGSAEAAAEHALTLIELGRAAQAAAALEHAAAAAGEDARAHWVVADTLLRLDDDTAGADRLPRARAAFARASALDAGAAIWHATEALRCTSAGRREEARGLIARGAALMPGDAELAHMAAAADGHTPQRASGAYVAAHFDAFADSFDDVLVERLGYRLLDLICGALERQVAAGAALDVLDAGCGTGLCAPRLRPLARRLVGLDLSARMVQRASDLELYDELVVADLAAWLGEDERAAAFDAIVAADVLVYFGDLQAPLRAAAHALRPGGVLVFSTERAAHGHFALERSGRFSHDPGYVDDAAVEAGFEVVEAGELSYRVEGGDAVAATLTCLRSRPGADGRPTGPR